MSVLRRIGGTRGVIGTLIVFVIAAGCIRLGIWQLERLAQRRALNARAAEQMTQPPVDVDRVPDDTTAALWLRVRMHGGCEGEQVVLAARSRHGTPGVHLLCRFRTRSGRTVLLDRGWLPSPDAHTIGADAYAQAPRDTTLEALIVPFPPGEAVARGRTAVGLSEADRGVELASPEPRVIYRMNRAQAVAATGAQLPAWYAQALGSSDRFPIPTDPPEPGDGPHLGYAVQWFSFAAIALIGWLVLVLRGRSGSGGPSGSQGPASAHPGPSHGPVPIRPRDETTTRKRR